MFRSKLRGIKPNEIKNPKCSDGLHLRKNWGCIMEVMKDTEVYKEFDGRFKVPLGRCVYISIYDYYRFEVLLQS